MTSSYLTSYETAKLRKILGLMHDGHSYACMAARPTIARAWIALYDQHGDDCLRHIEALAETRDHIQATGYAAGRTGEAPGGQHAHDRDFLYGYAAGAVARDRQKTGREA